MYLDRFFRYALPGIFFCSFQVFAQTKPQYKLIFNTAEKLANTENHTDETDEQAFANYKKVITLLTTTHLDDAFLLKAYITTGAFLQVLDRQKEAIPYFKKSFALKNNISGVNDSALFKPLVYCGNSYYKLDKPDSADYYYKKAESVAESYPQVSELERLYNTLGVIAYATGNYKKSTTYYEKAITTLLGHSAYDKSLLVTYKSNLATAYRKLKRYNEALKIYRELLLYKVETDNLFHNIGSVYLALGDGKTAVTYLKRVKPLNQKLLNDLARAYFIQNDFNSAALKLREAAEMNARLNGSHKNSDYGITLKYSADLFMQKNDLPAALQQYQLAVNNLQFDFNSQNIYINPSDFNSVFYTADLLETLLAKATAFKLLYTQSHHTRDLEAALQTYLSFYKLADHIQRFYETDDARLLISDKKYTSHQQPIDICLQLFSLTKNEKYIKLAFFLDEENKGNTLSLNLEESKLKAAGNVSKQLLQQERNLKERITRELLKASAQSDSVTLANLKNRVNDYTIQLVKVQQKINQQTGLNKLKHPDEANDIEALQKIIPGRSAILSYHIGNADLVCFVITSAGLHFVSTPLPAGFISLVNKAFKQAQYRNGNNNKEMRNIAQTLYRQLIKPAEALLDGKENLMIIPDDELNYLPFEILAGDSGELLLKKYTVTYNYSCNVLLSGSNAGLAADATRLGIAPFNDKVITNGQNVNEWVQLSASKQEVEALNGVSFYNKQATKQMFLKQAPNFNIIHLATHAYANDKDPNQSFISFYPSQPDSAFSYKLYLPEIYNLKLDKTRLVILSACESGSGELVKGEGLMSIARAFSYSGCNNIITSMWKADDASTAYISAKLHYYLQKGYSIAAALQQAKLDYLGDDTISDGKKLTGYWAHLRLTGSFEKQDDKQYLTVVISALILLAGALMVLKSRSRFKRPRPN